MGKLVVWHSRNWPEGAPGQCPILFHLPFSACCGREADYHDLRRSRGTTSRRANGYVESSNGRLRDECLNETLFAALNHARLVQRRWRDDYSHVRPRSGIGGLTLAHAAKRLARHRQQGHDGNLELYLWPVEKRGAGHSA